jgi:flagellar protein FlaF
MGTASLIATSVAILLLVITAYVLVGGTLATAEVVIAAQRDAANHQEARIRTGITITHTLHVANASTLYVLVENSGSEPVADFDHLDLFLADGGAPVYYPRGAGAGTWSLVSIDPDVVHPGVLDPDEAMNISVLYTGGAPAWVQASTGNGICDSVYV